MTNRDQLIASVSRIGQMLSASKKGGKKLSRTQIKDSLRVLNNARMALRRDRFMTNKASKKLSEQKTAAYTSMKNKTLSAQAGKKSMAELMTKMQSLKDNEKILNKALISVNSIIRGIKKHSASESDKIHKEDKGHSSEEAIKSPKSPEAIGTDATGESSTPDTEKGPDLDVKKDAEGQPSGTGDALAKPQASKKRLQNLNTRDLVKRMYTRAASLVKSASEEKDAAKKAKMAKKATLLEARADKLFKKIPTKKSVKSVCKETTKQGTKEVEKKATKKESNKPVFATQDKVLLSDGSIGTVSSVSGDTLMVSVAGVEKKVSANTVKKVSNSSKASERMSDKISQAISQVKASKKKKAGEEPDIAIQMDDTTDDDIKTVSPAENTVSHSEVKTVDFIEGEGYVVNKSENEVISFGEDKDAAEKYVEACNKKVKAQASLKQRIADRIKSRKASQKGDTVIDSADHSPAEGSQDIGKKMKGLDQKSKDYGKATSEEKVNPATGPVGHNKAATATTPESPVDSAIAKKPKSQENIVSKIKGLTQKGKGYGNTKSEQKADPERSVYAKKNKILEVANKKKTARLKELESNLLVDRAIKVGAVTEADRPEQQKILAELYDTNVSEFKAYARLIANMEKNSKNASVKDRVHTKVANAMKNRNSSVVTESDVEDASLDSGNFFD